MIVTSKVLQPVINWTTRWLVVRLSNDVFALFSGERHMTINIHNLLHINASVQNHGPLWANSTFEFEDANGELTALFHGTQNIDMQVIKVIIINNTNAHSHTCGYL